MYTLGTILFYPYSHPLHSLVLVQSLSHVQLFEIPWTAARQAFWSFTISQSLLKVMSISASVVPFSYCPQSFPVSRSNIYLFLITYKKCYIVYFYIFFCLHNFINGISKTPNFGLVHLLQCIFAFFLINFCFSSLCFLEFILLFFSLTSYAGCLPLYFKDSSFFPFVCVLSCSVVWLFVTLWTGSSVQGIFQASKLEWVAISFSMESSWNIAGGFFTAEPSGKLPFFPLRIWIAL